jgi:hypothetical protein
LFTFTFMSSIPTPLFISSFFHFYLCSPFHFFLSPLHSGVPSSALLVTSCFFFFFFHFYSCLLHTPLYFFLFPHSHLGSNFTLQQPDWLLHLPANQSPPTPRPV